MSHEIELRAAYDGGLQAGLDSRQAEIDALKAHVERMAIYINRTIEACNSIDLVDMEKIEAPQWLIDIEKNHNAEIEKRVWNEAINIPAQIAKRIRTEVPDAEKGFVLRVVETITEALREKANE